MTDGQAPVRESDPAALDQSGRPLGPRALETREKLLGATAQLLAERSLRELRVIDIARRVGSPATFYQYFKDVEEAVLRLAEQASDEMPKMVALIESDWRDPDAARARCRELVDAFIHHWDEHQAVLRVRNLASDEGDARFRAVRSRAMSPILKALARKIEAAQRSGAIGADDHPAAAAAALASILERLAAYHAELEVFGVRREDLVRTSSNIIHRTLTGRD